MKKITSIFILPLVICAFSVSANAQEKNKEHSSKHHGKKHEASNAVGGEKTTSIVEKKAVEKK